jgi:hypothetical protein
MPNAKEHTMELEKEHNKQHVKRKGSREVLIHIAEILVAAVFCY